MRKDRLDSIEFPSLTTSSETSLEFAPSSSEWYEFYKNLDDQEKALTKEEALNTDPEADTTDLLTNRELLDLGILQLLGKSPDDTLTDEERESIKHFSFGNDVVWMGLNHKYLEDMQVFYPFDLVYLLKDHLLQLDVSGFDNLSAVELEDYPEWYNPQWWFDQFPSLLELKIKEGEVWVKNGDSLELVE